MALVSKTCKLSVCGYCNKTIERPLYHFKKFKHVFCNRSCYTEFQKSKKNSEESNKKRSIALLGEKNHFYGKHHSEESIAKIKVNRNQKGTGDNNYFFGKRLIGELNGNWRGGVTPEHDKVRHNDRIKRWRKEVYKRDNYTCQECGIRSGAGKVVYLNAHHIKPFKDYAELRFEVSNGITYCESCHKEIHRINKIDYKGNLCNQSL